MSAMQSEDETKRKSRGPYKRHGAAPIRDLAPMMILSVLKDGGSLHGLAISREVDRVTNGQIGLGQASLYPVLHVLSEKGMVRGEWKVDDDGPPRKEYTITDRGVKRLQEMRADWILFSENIVQNTEVHDGVDINEQRDERSGRLAPA